MELLPNYNKKMIESDGGMMKHKLLVIARRLGLVRQLEILSKVLLDLNLYCVATKIARFAFRCDKKNYRLLAISDIAHAYLNKSSIETTIRKRMSRVRKPKIAVLGAIINDYDSIKMPTVIEDDVDYLLVTNGDINSSLWQILTIDTANLDKTMISRYIKTHPSEFANGYDYVFWVDASITIRCKLTEVVKDFINSGKDLGVVRHPYRKTILEEAHACIVSKKGDADIIKKQVEFYIRDGFSTSELIETGVVLYDTANPKTRNFTESWWEEISRFSNRDQLSVNYCLNKNDIQPFLIITESSGLRSSTQFLLHEHSADDEFVSSAYKKLNNSFIMDGKYLCMNASKSSNSIKFHYK